LPRFGARLIGSIDSDDIERLIDELHKKKLSESTIANHLRPLAGTFRYAIGKKYVQVNPLLLIAEGYQVSSNATREHHEWTSAEVQAVIAAARQLDAGKGARRGYALITETLFRCGLRLGECLGLQFGDIDFEGSTLSVRRSWNRDCTIGPPKTKDSIRRVPVPDDLLKRLASLSLDAESSAFVFALGANPPSQTNYRRRGWNPAIGRAGLTGRITPHDARHAFTSQLADIGITSNDLAATLGHSSARTTEAIYVHAFNADEREARIRKAMEAATTVGERG